MRNSTMSLSEKRYLHHCSFRSEKNQRTWDKLITLIKKVCCQLSPFSHVQVRGDPCTNEVQICLKNGNQVATWKTSKSGFSLKDKKSKFLLKSDLRSRSTNFKPSLTKKYPGINWNYWFSANGSWSYYCRVWPIQTRSITNWRRIIRTTIGLFVKLVSGMCETWKNCRKFTCQRSRNFQEENWLKTKTRLWS